MPKNVVVTGNPLAPLIDVARRIAEQNGAVLFEKVVGTTIEQFGPEISILAMASTTRIVVVTSNAELVKWLNYKYGNVIIVECVVSDYGNSLYGNDKSENTRLLAEFLKNKTAFDLATQQYERVIEEFRL
jgi:hypothetical protein